MQFQRLEKKAQEIDRSQVLTPALGSLLTGGAQGFSEAQAEIMVGFERLGPDDFQGPIKLLLDQTAETTDVDRFGRKNTFFRYEGQDKSILFDLYSDECREEEEIASGKDISPERLAAHLETGIRRISRVYPFDIFGHYAMAAAYGRRDPELVEVVAQAMLKERKAIFSGEIPPVIDGFHYYGVLAHIYPIIPWFCSRLLLGYTGKSNAVDELYESALGLI